MAAALLLILLFLSWPWLPGMALTQRPPLLAPSSDAAPATPSFLRLPIAFSLRELERRLETAFKDPLLDTQSRSDGRTYQIRVNRRGAARLLGESEKLTLILPLAFDVNSPGGGLFQPRLHTSGEVSVHVALEFGISPDWQLQVQLRPRFDWDRHPYVYVGPFRFKISGIIGREIQKALEKQATKLEQEALNSLEIRSKAEQAWRGLFTPRQLRKEPEVWLTVLPRSLHWLPPSSDEETLTLTLGLLADLNTVAGGKPAGLEPTPLPPLAQQMPEQGGFRLNMPVLLDFEGIEQELRRTQSGRQITLDGGVIELHDFEVYASRERLVVGVEFIANAKGPWLDTRGKVYFTGVPSYDADTRTLSLSEFDFTQRVNNPLVHWASWILRDSLRADLARQLSWDATQPLLRAQDDLSGDLNRSLGNGLTLWGEVTGLDLQGLSLMRQGLELRFAARGELVLMYGF